MKYNLHINQKQAIELGIKNFQQAHIFDLLSMCSTWAAPVHLDGEVYYWVARQKIITELPLMDIKPDTAYRHLKALADLGLIDHVKQGVKDLIRLTDLGKSYHSDTMSEKNPNKLGKKSESYSEKNPTYNTTSKHNTTKDTKDKQKLDLSEIDPPKELNIKAWQSWMEFKKHKKPYTTEQGVKTAMKTLAKLSFEQQQACIDSSIGNEYQGFFPEKFIGTNNGKPKQSIYEQNMEAHEKDRNRIMGEDENELSFELVPDERSRLLN